MKFISLLGVVLGLVGVFFVLMCAWADADQAGDLMAYGLMIITLGMALTLSAESDK